MRCNSNNHSRHSAKHQSTLRFVPERLPRFYAHLQRLEDEKRLAKIILEAEDAADESEPPTLVRRSADGHPRRLRGLPAVGRNVSGATVHTDPVPHLLWKEAQRRR